MLYESEGKEKKANRVKAICVFFCFGWLLSVAFFFGGWNRCSLVGFCFWRTISPIPKVSGTGDGSEIRRENHLRCCWNPVNNWDKLPYQLVIAGFQPSTIWSGILASVAQIIPNVTCGDFCWTLRLNGWISEVIGVILPRYFHTASTMPYHALAVDAIFRFRSVWGTGTSPLTLPPPKKINMSPEERPFQKERLVFQPAFFGGIY